MSDAAGPPRATCQNCALMLARIARSRYWWFPLVREPLVLGMRFLARWHGIDARSYPVHNPDCSGCIRFVKNELEERSPLFRVLNELIGRRFSRLRDARISLEERAEAKRYARESMGA